METDMKIGLVDGCAFLARRVHAEQTYGEDQPYTVHLEATVAVMRRFGIKDEVKLGAGWLHDSIEDTDLTITALTVHLGTCFGEAAAVGVAELVNAVTDGEGKNRAERKARSYELIPKTKGAVLVKLADRIANAEEGHAKDNGGLLTMYRKELPNFEANLLDVQHAAKHKIEGLMWRYYQHLLSPDYLK